ncbi:MAG: S9 family peptidase [Woeseiaceae bacterium]|nr:S9 family peptidase [Woeseiaceae bacterium]
MKRIFLLTVSVFFVAACGDQSSDVAPASGAEEQQAAAPAGPPTQIPREIIFGNPDRTLARISPDGAHLSWLAPDNGIMNVWVAPVDDPESATVITQDDYRGIQNYFWAPNSEFIYYLQDEGGNENFHVYSANIANGEVIDLTPVADGVRAQIEAVSADYPDQLVVGLNERNSQVFDLYMVNGKTGERELIQENPGFMAWVIDHDLKPRLGQAPTPDGGATLVDMEGNVVTEIPTADFLNTFATGFNASNDAIYMIDTRGRDKAALTSLSLESGEITVLAESDVADVSGILTDPRTHEPIAYNVDYLKSSWSALNDETAADLEALTAALPGSLAIVARTQDMSKWVVHEDSSSQSGAYYIYDRESGSVTKMLDQRPALADYTLAPMQALELESRDGLTLVSYLTLPLGSDADGDGVPEEALPMMLWVHGGPWARDQYGYSSVHQWLANRGYAVLSVNYRGSTGFGKAFTRGSVGEWAGKMHDDLIDAVEWAVDSGVAIEDKVAIGGGSYGGYATLVGLTFTPDTFACGVDIVGPSNLITLLESFPDYWAPFLEGTFYLDLGNPANEEDREFMMSRSPLSRVDQISAPLLVGQGQNDPRVTKIEADQIVESMAERELPVTYVNFPDEGHGFARPENRLAFFSVMEGFLEGCLGGTSEPVNDAFEGSSIEILYGRGYVANLPQEEGSAAE